MTEPAVRSVRPGIRLVMPPAKKGSAWESPNIYLVGDGPITMIDSGYDREEDVRLILEAIGGAALERIVLTHGHIDHAGGAWSLREATGAEVWAHPAEAQALGRRFPGREIDRELDPDAVIRAGGFALKVVMVPGHSPGHAALWIEEEGVFFSGDLITGQGSTLVAPPEGNMVEYMRSLRTAQKMPIRTILPGHGPVVENPAARIAELIERRELREICIAKALAKGPMNLKELVRAMYAGLIHPGLEMAAAATAWSHLDKMFADGLVVFEPEDESNPFNRAYRLAPGVVLPF